MPSADAFGRVLLELQCHCDIQANKGPRALQHKAKSATPEPAAPMASIRGGAAATSRPLKATSRENRRSGAHREAEAAELARVPQWPRQMVQPESNRGPGAPFRPRVAYLVFIPPAGPEHSKSAQVGRGRARGVAECRGDRPVEQHTGAASARATNIAQSGAAKRRHEISYLDQPRRVRSCCLTHREREREGGREKERDGDRQKERERERDQ